MEEIIARFLESNKRLVIPQLGAFIVKEPGQSVLFSEMLKRDDGVLVALVAQGGVDQIEASAQIEAFVNRVRTAIKGGQSYNIDGLGVLKAGENSTIAFQYRAANLSAETTKPIEIDPLTTQKAEKSAQPTDQQSSEDPQQPNEQSSEDTQLTDQQSSEDTQQKDRDVEAPNPAPQQVQSPNPQPSTNQSIAPESQLIEQTPPQEIESQQPKQEQESGSTRLRDFSDSRKRISDMVRNVKVEQQPTGQIDGFDTSPIQSNELKISPSAKLNPEPHVKGLRYGKPHRNNNPFANSKGRRKIDRFLLFALASALVAVAVIAYVYFRDSRERRQQMQDQIEQTTQSEAQQPQTEDTK